MELFLKLKNVNIFFDLDGTLIDSRERLYLLFQYLVPKSGMNFNEYWDLKRNKHNHSSILKNHFDYTAENIQNFETKWMHEIELSNWLDYDRPFEGIYACLMALNKDNKLYLVTARQSEEIALRQISKFGWIDLFEKVFVTGQKVEKFDLIKRNVDVSSDDWFVGDTGKDIQTGKLLGVRTAAVLSGFLSKKHLLEYEPDLIADNVVSINFN